MPSIQLEQALFELHNSVVGNRRAIDRLVAATIVGEPVGLAGPSGVGKTHLVDAVRRIFGLRSVELGAAALAASPALEPGCLYVVDRDDWGRAHLDQLAQTLCRSTGANVVVTTTATDPALMPSRLRDELVSYIEIPYPSASEEMALALDGIRPHSIDRILRADDLAAMRSVARRMPILDHVVSYAVRAVQATRSPARHGLANLAPLIAAGASPRASIGLVSAARGMAVLAGRDEVTHQDVYEAAFEGLLHRVELSEQAVTLGVTSRDVVVEVLSRVAA